MNPYFSNENITIYHGDSLEVLPEIQFATCVALDPPYSMVPNSFSGKDDGAAGTSAAPVKLLAETLKHTRRILAEGGCAGLICDWRRLPDISYMATLFGLRINTCVAWTRSTAGMGKLFRSAWDPMLVLSSGTPNVKDNAGIRNVYHENKPRGSSHPYEKPVGLWLHLFNRLPAGVLVDPYAGTGSALEAGILAGHKVIGIETDEKYCELMVKRLAELRQPTPRAVDSGDSHPLPLTQSVMTTLYRLHFPAPHQIRIQQIGFGVYDYSRTELEAALQPDRDIPAERRAVFSKAFDMLNYYDKKRRKHNERN